MRHRQILQLQRLLFFLAGDIVLLTGGLLLSFVILAPNAPTLPSLSAFLPLWALSLAIKLPLLRWQRLYAMSWSFVGLEDLLRVVLGLALGSVALAAVALTLRPLGGLPEFPPFILLLDYAFGLLGVGGFRISRRVYLQALRRPVMRGEATLIVGAGAAGDQLARSLLSSPQAGCAPVGFLDDDPGKHGTILHGLPVLGSLSDLTTFIQQQRASRVVIAMPSAPSKVVREIVAQARSVGVTNVGILPGLPHIVDGRISPVDVREVQLEDLLGRGIVTVDTQGISAAFSGRRILVTGAGGTIGAELCRQLLRFSPASLAMLEHEETALFDAHRELTQLQVEKLASEKVDESGQLVHSPGMDIIPVLADIRDAPRMRELFGALRPEVVLHAAAYKHVGMLERHPEEAVCTNVLGTAVLAEAAIEAGVERFVLVSTDKAVIPSSVMGATKRVAEQLCLALNNRGTTRFTAVRFGNVLGSRGSVIPIFKEQIRRGGPVTVRGADVRRYFMAVSEAVLLVLQAGAMGQGGEVLVLDMGQPIKILDLARELIRLSGLEPDRDVQIAITELEPGEKQFEDILMAEEGTMATRHEKIYVARLSSPMPAEQVLQGVARLRELAHQGSCRHMIHLLQELVPAYRPSAIALSADANPMNMKTNLRPNP